MANILDEIDKLCFKCTLPPEVCGTGVQCAYIIATKDDPGRRRKVHKIQHTCGFPDTNKEDD